MSQKIPWAVLTLIAFLAAIPLTIIASGQGFGLGALLTVPTCCLGFWFALTSKLRSNRIGWFVFSCANASLLPVVSWWKPWIEDGLHWCQDSIRANQWTSLYQGVEALAVLAMPILPWLFGCWFGFVCSKLAARLLSQPPENEQPSYRFSMRELLVTVLASAILITWISTFVRQWHTQENLNQAQMLQRFKDSFTSGKIKLLAEPVIVEDHAVLKPSQHSSGFSEYRIVAPINKADKNLWAAWSYACYDNSVIHRFGYVEADSKSALPGQPFPFPRILREPTLSMVDGEPPQTTKARIVEAPVAARPGDTITIVCETDQFMECDLVLHPFHATALPPKTTSASATGIAKWNITIDPAFKGKAIEFEFQSRVNSVYRTRSIRGKISLEKARDDP